MASWLTLRTTLAALLVGSAALFAIGVAIERSQPQHSAAREAAERAAEAPVSAPGVATTAGEETPAEHAREGTPTTTSGESPTKRAGEARTATTAPKTARSAREAGESPAQRAHEGATTTTTPKTTEHAATTTGGESPAERSREGGAGVTASKTTATLPAATVAEVHSEQVFGLNPDAAGLVAAAIAASLLLAFGVWRFPTMRPLLVLVALAALAFCAFDVREAVHQASESRTGLVIVAAFVAALHLAAAVVALAMARGNTPLTSRPGTAST